MLKNQEQMPDAIRRYAISREKCIFEEKHLRLFNGIITIGAGLSDVLSCKRLYAPPYASSDFELEIRIDGELVPLSDYTWYPSELHRNGSMGNISVSSILIPLAGKKAFLLRVNVKNRGGAGRPAKISLKAGGSLEWLGSASWGFYAPQTKLETDSGFDPSGNILLLSNPAGRMALATTLGKMEFSGIL